MKRYQYPSFEWAQKALQFARARYPIGSNNKSRPGPTSKHPLGGEERLKIADAQRGKPGALAGNCGEMAHAAFEYLSTYKVLPVEVMCLQAPGDHVFAVLNRDKSTPVENINLWNSGTIVCDPWANFVCWASEYAAMFAAKMRKWKADNKDVWMVTDHQRAQGMPGGFNLATNWEDAITRHQKKYCRSQMQDRVDPPDHYNVYLWDDFATFETYKDGKRDTHLRWKSSSPASCSDSDTAYASRVVPVHLAQRPALCFSFARDPRDTPRRISDDGHVSSHGYERCLKQMNSVLYGCSIPTNYTLYMSRKQVVDRITAYAGSNPSRLI